MSGENGRQWKMIATIVTGICAGILLASLLLFFLRASSHDLRLTRIAVMAVLCAFFPLCISRFAEKYTVALVVQMMTVLVSFLVFLLYGRQVAGDESTARAMMLGAFWIHLPALLFLVLWHFMGKKGEKSS